MQKTKVSRRPVSCLAAFFLLPALANGAETTAAGPGQMVLERVRAAVTKADQELNLAVKKADDLCKSGQLDVEHISQATKDKLNSVKSNLPPKLQQAVQNLKSDLNQKTQNIVTWAQGSGQVDLSELRNGINAAKQQANTALDSVESLCKSGQLDIEGSFTQIEADLKSELKTAGDTIQQAIQDAKMAQQQSGKKSGSAL